MATSEETREVRCVVGSGSAGPELWYYIPHMSRDQNRHVRRGWWLHPCDEEDLHGLHYIGPLVPVQRNKTTIVEDVGVLADFPFVRTDSVKLTAKGEEIADNIYVRTARPFNDDELAVPRADMQTAIERWRLKTRQPHHRPLALVAKLTGRKKDSTPNAVPCGAASS